MEQFERARHILENNRESVETLSAALLERESIDADEFQLIMNGEALPEPELTVEVDHSTGEEGREDEEPDGPAPGPLPPEPDPGGATP